MLIVSMDGASKLALTRARKGVACFALVKASFDAPILGRDNLASVAGPDNIPVLPDSPMTAPCGASVAPVGKTTAPRGASVAPVGKMAAPCGASVAPVGKMAAPNAPIVAPGDARSAPCLPNTGNPPLSLKAIELITDVMCRELGVGASKLALTGAASVAFPMVLSKQALTLPSCSLDGSHAPAW